MKNRVSLSSDIENAPSEERTVDFLLRIMEKLEYDREEVSVLYTNDEAIARLNREYRGIEGATDVLSFENDGEYSDEEGKWKTVGDIIISLETVKKNADYFEVDFDEELKRLLLHSLLHLHGMDHGEEHLEKGKKPECEMLVLQEKILQQFENCHITEG